MKSLCISFKCNLHYSTTGFWPITLKTSGSARVISGQNIILPNLKRAELVDGGAYE